MTIERTAAKMDRSRAPARLTRMGRYFTLQEAQDRLPEVRAQLEIAVEAVRRIALAEHEVAEAVGRAQVLGGVRLDAARMASLAALRAGAARRLQDSVIAIHELGAQVKDLESGLVDFPTIYRGAAVLLCWKAGETGIGHWHGLEEGFQGRKRIDRDFVDHHEGGEDPVGGE